MSGITDVAEQIVATATASSISSSLTVSGGAKRNAVGVTALVDEPGSEQTTADLAGIATVELGGEQQATPPDTEVTAGISSRLRRDARPWHLGEPRCVDATHLVDDRHDGRRGQRTTGVRAPVVARFEGGSDIGSRPARPDRHAVAHPLRQGDDIGNDVGVLEPEPAPRAPEPGLHLVEDQQRAGLVALRRNPREELGIGRD